MSRFCISQRRLTERIADLPHGHVPRVVHGRGLRHLLVGSLEGRGLRVVLILRDLLHHELAVERPLLGVVEQPVRVVDRLVGRQRRVGALLASPPVHVGRVPASRQEQRQHRAVLIRDLGVRLHELVRPIGRRVAELPVGQHREQRVHPVLVEHLPERRIPRAGLAHEVAVLLRQHRLRQVVPVAGLHQQVRLKRPGAHVLKQTLAERDAVRERVGVFQQPGLPGVVHEPLLVEVTLRVLREELRHRRLHVLRDPLGEPGHPDTGRDRAEPARQGGLEHARIPVGIHVRVGHESPLHPVRHRSLVGVGAVERRRRDADGRADAREHPVLEQQVEARERRRSRRGGRVDRLTAVRHRHERPDGREHAASDRDAHHLLPGLGVRVEHRVVRVRRVIGEPRGARPLAGSVEELRLVDLLRVGGRELPPHAERVAPRLRERGREAERVADSVALLCVVEQRLDRVHAVLVRDVLQVGQRELAALLRLRRLTLQLRQRVLRPRPGDPTQHRLSVGHQPGRVLRAQGGRELRRLVPLRVPELGQVAEILLDVAREGEEGVGRSLDPLAERVLGLTVSPHRGADLLDRERRILHPVTGSVLQQLRGRVAALEERLRRLHAEPVRHLVQHATREGVLHDRRVEVEREPAPPGRQRHSLVAEQVRLEVGTGLDLVPEGGGQLLQPVHAGLARPVPQVVEESLARVGDPGLTHVPLQRLGGRTRQDTQHVGRHRRRPHEPELVAPAAEEQRVVGADRHLAEAHGTARGAGVEERHVAGLHAAEAVDGLEQVAVLALEAGEHGPVDVGVCALRATDHPADSGLRVEAVRQRQRHEPVRAGEHRRVTRQEHARLDVRHVAEHVAAAEREHRGAPELVQHGVLRLEHRLPQLRVPLAGTLERLRRLQGAAHFAPVRGHHTRGHLSLEGGDVLRDRLPVQRQRGATVRRASLSRVGREAPLPGTGRLQRTHERLSLLRRQPLLDRGALRERVEHPVPHGPTLLRRVGAEHRVDPLVVERASLSLRGRAPQLQHVVDRVGGQVRHALHVLDVARVAPRDVPAGSGVRPLDRLRGGRERLLVPGERLVRVDAAHRGTPHHPQTHQAPGGLVHHAAAGVLHEHAAHVLDRLGVRELGRHARRELAARQRVDGRRVVDRSDRTVQRLRVRPDQELHAPVEVGHVRAVRRLAEAREILQEVDVIGRVAGRRRDASLPRSLRGQQVHEREVLVTRSLVRRDLSQHLLPAPLE